MRRWPEAGGAEPLKAAGPRPRRSKASSRARSEKGAQFLQGLPERVSRSCGAGEAGRAGHGGGYGDPGFTA